MPTFRDLFVASVLTYAGYVAVVMFVFLVTGANGAKESTMIRAKMVLQSKDDGRAVFHCQYDEKVSQEDAGFQKATPSGRAEFQIDNPKAIEQLEPGKAYYFDISPAD